MAGAIKAVSLSADISVDDNLDSGLGKARGKLTGFASGMTGQFAMLAGSLGAAIGGAKVMEGAINLDRTMSNIRAVTGRTAAETATLRNELLSISSTKSPQEIAAAFYDVAGGVSNAALHMPILSAAVALAEAGQADLAVSTQGLVSVMNAYNASADSAAFFSDVYTLAVGRGVGTMDEFVAALSPLGGLAASSGVGFAELGGAMALMTQKGTSAAMGGTQLKAAMTALLNPNEKLKAALDKMGVASGKALIEQKGLAGALNAIKEAAGGSVDQMAPLLGSVEALQAAAVMAGPDFEKFFTDFQAGIDGATDTARQAQLDSVSAKFDIFRNRLEGVALSIGSAVLPVLNGLFDGIGQFAQDVQTEGLVGAVSKWLGAAKGWLETEGKRILEEALKSAFTFIQDAANWVVTNAPAVWQGIETWLGDAWAWIRNNAPVLLGEAMKAIFTGLKNIGEWVIANAPSIVEGIRAWLEGAWVWIRTEGVNFLGDALKAMINGAGSVFGVADLWGNLQTTLSQLGTIIQIGIDSARGTIETAWNSVFSPDPQVGFLAGVWNSLFGEGSFLGGLFNNLFGEAGIISTGVAAVRGWLDTLLQKGKDIAAGIGSAFGALVDLLTLPFREVINFIGRVMIEASKAGGMFSSLAGLGQQLINASGLGNRGTQNPATGGGKANLNTLPKFAQGGTMLPNVPALVGERGTEVVVPGRVSTVIPNHALGGVGGGGAQEINLNLDGQTIYQVVLRQGRIVNHRPILAGARG